MAVVGTCIGKQKRNYRLLCIYIKQLYVENATISGKKLPWDKKKQIYYGHMC